MYQNSIKEFESYPDQYTNSYFLSHLTNDDYFPEYLWREREIFDYETIEFRETNNVSHTGKLEIEIRGSTNLKVGDIIKIEYKIPEGDKERIQSYEGLVISKQNRSLGKSFTLRRTVAGVGVEQIFLLNSPKIVSVTKKQSSKVRRAKLYYLRNRVGKATRLKENFNIIRN
jgi:large subunit ribosomal protein L19